MTNTSSVVVALVHRPGWLRARTLTRLAAGYLLWILAGLAASCSDTALTDTNVAIDDRRWDYENKPRIEVDVADASQRYDVFLNLRHTNKYTYSNIFVLLHQHDPDGGRDTTRVEIRLAAPDGRWLGSGSGAIFSHQHLVRDNYTFPDTGRYVFLIEQNMRENPLPEVTDVGIRIAPATNP